jgi:succinyl-CoA:acetate CoA-transferase
MKKRAPYQTNGDLQKALNDGRVEYIDQHLSHSAQQYRKAYYGKINVAIIEACAITEEGHIVPTTSMGNSPSFVQEADIVIVEVNTAQPAKLEGMHDVYIPLDPPNRQPIPIVKTDDLIGTPYIVAGPDKITAVVMSDVTDKVRPLAPLDDESKKMAANLIGFLKGEVEKGCLPPNLLPLQSGVGNVANAVLAGLADSDFEGLEFYSEVIQDAAFDLIDCGKFVAVSGTSLTPSETGLQRFIDKIDFYREKIILRPQEISNNQK